MYNKVILIGRLTKDIELQKTKDSEYGRFGLAVNEFRGKDKEDHVDFINCIAWNDLAKNMATHLSKGSLVQVDGKIRTGSYTNKEGATIYTTDIVVNNVVFLDSKPKEEQAPVVEEDLPF